MIGQKLLAPPRGWTPVRSPHSAAGYHADA